MKYVNFGKAGVNVSQVALGLGLRGQNDAVEVERMISYAIDQGINFIDCANIYGTMDNRANIGQSEIILGRAIKNRRDNLVITSKVCSSIGSGANDSGLSRYHILREIDRSLKRLGTDHVDIYLIHAPDARTPLAETLRAMDDIVRSGKARYVGCCNFPAWKVCQSLWVADQLGVDSIVGIQNPYSLLNRRLELEMFDLLTEMELGMMAYSPLAVGLLSGIYQPSQNPPIGSYWAQHLDQFTKQMQGNEGQVIETLIKLAQEISKTPAQLAQAWILSRPEVTVFISGSDSISQIEDNIGAVGWKIDSQIMKELDAVSASFAT